jgi:hypothetical protein
MNIEPILQKKENPPLVLDFPLGRNDKNMDNEIIRYDMENKRFFTDNTPLSFGCKTVASVASPIEEDEEGEQ